MSKGVIPVNESLYHYIVNVSVRESDLLARLREETNALGGISRMQISADQGQFMGLLAKLIGARHVLEVGTFTGYSTLSFAQAIPDDGHVVACDISAEWTSIARRYWKEAGMNGKIDLKLGPASETLAALLNSGCENRFDLMFIDADKIGYDTYYEQGLRLVRPGGLILIDNVLWSGSVIDPEDKDEDTEAIRRLNAKLYQDERIDLSLVPVGDGLTLARKR